MNMATEWHLNDQTVSLTPQHQQPRRCCVGAVVASADRSVCSAHRKTHTTTLARRALAAGYKTHFPSLFAVVPGARFAHAFANKTPHL